MHSIADVLFVSGMLAAAASDLGRRRVPNALNVAILAAGLGLHAIDGGIGSAAAGAALGLALLLAPFAAGWIGGGDAKLVCAAGAWLGPAGVLWATLFGLVGGGLLAAAIAASGSRSLRAEVATNLRTAALALATPHAPRRGRGQLVPLAVPIAAAAIGVYFALRGFHA